ncbi:MAG: hypothetical protein ABH835_00345, partial [Patescibacteria group bacterium]
ISSKKYDLIVSISTIEHVGYDENPKDSMGFVPALASLKKYLSPVGKMVITFPLGYSPQLDKAFKEKNLGLAETYCLKRVSPFNKWQEVECREVSSIKYDQPYHAGNAVVIGIIK